MRPRNETDPRRMLAGMLVIVPARDEADEIEGCLHSQAHPDVRWVVSDSDADTVGGARAEGVLAGRAHEAIADLHPDAVWVASTDADSRVPYTWLVVQRDLADTGTDLVLGSVAPVDDGSTSVRLCRGMGDVAEKHGAIRAANLGVRLSAYDRVGGFEDRDDREDVQLVHAVRAGAGLPSTSTDRARVLTSARRVGRRNRGFARFLGRLDDAVAGVDADELAVRLRLELLRRTSERGAGQDGLPLGGVRSGRPRTATGAHATCPRGGVHPG